MGDCRQCQVDFGYGINDNVFGNITDMSTFLKKQPTALTEYDEQLIRRLIEKVSIYEDKFIVEFKSGVTVDVNK